MRIGLVWLALIAFSAQFCLAQTHRHHHVSRKADFAARAMTAGRCATSAARQCDTRHDHHGEDGCLLCWAATVAGNSLAAPDAPVVAAPSIVGRAKFDNPRLSTVAMGQRRHFQARAPPLFAIV